MHIFKLLSEEVFDFNRGELTQAKTRMLKTQLSVEFGRIHELCHFVLSSVDLWTARPNLIKATLAALQVCLVLCLFRARASASRKSGHQLRCTLP